MILRITLPQAVKILTPVGAFVICNHACKFNRTIYIDFDILDIFLEILGLFAYDHIIMFLICSPISLIFLIYSYAIMMNGKAAE